MRQPLPEQPQAVWAGKRPKNQERAFERPRKGAYHDMISSEGYKAFHGTMRITPKNPNMEPFDLTCDWLYKPEYQCWYGKGSSFMEEICEVLVDLTAPPLNGPLTFDQLREMDGEPVWIEWAGHPQAGWALVRVWSKVSNTIYLTYHNGNTDLLGFVLNDGAKIYRHRPEERTV